MRNKKKDKHSFWKRIRFKYRLSAFNENTLEEVWKIRASAFSGIVLFLLVAGILIAVTSVIIITTPVRYYLPGYLDSEVRDKAVRNAILADSIETELIVNRQYMDNVRKIFTGTVEIDSVTSVADTLYIPENDPSLQKSELERRFVEQYEEDERYNLSLLPYTVSQNDAVALFAPLKGIVTTHFDANSRRYGIEILGAGKSTVTAVAGGTIVYSGYDISNSYVIQIQHKNGYISFYKGCSAVLKSVGDEVRSGEAIAVLETRKVNGKDEATPLCFELWHDGYPVNPEGYITF